MKGIMFVVIVAVYAACGYLTGYLRARLWLHDAVLGPWLDWRLSQLEKARKLNGDEWRAWLVGFEADKAAYEALTNVLYSKTLPWDKAKGYARKEEP